ncbi:MAG: hypothetical protein IT204_17165 [Fimbriimonadaceae bacterium]|nr:hypothetical protein [Fimbriimonadaceae bacterium]
MNGLFVLCASESDRGLLERLLGGLAAGLEMIACGTRSDAVSRAISKVVLREQRVLLVVDAGTTDVAAAAHERRGICALAEGRPDQLAVVLAVPEMAACYLESPVFVQRHLPALDTPIARRFASLQPGEALGLLNPRFASGPERLLRILDTEPDVLAELRQTGFCLELIQALHTLREAGDFVRPTAL